MSRFHFADEEEILSGKTTDIYLQNTMDIFEKKGMGKENVIAEFTTTSLPDDYNWAIFVGLDEVLNLLEGKNVDVYALPEGTVFKNKGEKGVYTPVMFIEGSYNEFVIYETPVLGFICHTSGVATKSSRVKLAAGDKKVMSFGIRRMHPSISPVIDRAAFIGGCDSISCISGAEEVGIKPSGTMPHSLTIICEDPEKAFEAFHETLPEEVPRIALVDTYHDEKMETLMAYKAMGDDLFGIRLDTPSSRRGDLIKIVQEVKWEMKIRGINAKIITSGGMNEYSIPELKKAGVDSFGVGTSISNADTINFAMDIVEKEGKLVAKRGKYSGKKQAFRCPKCFNYKMKIWQNRHKQPLCMCGESMIPMLEKFMEKGRIIKEYPDPKDIKERVNSQLEKLEVDWI